MRTVLSFRPWISAVPRRCASSTQYRKTPSLPNGTIKTFQKNAFIPAQPFLFPRGIFACLPAVEKWFVTEEQASKKLSRLNIEYLKPYGSMIVPLEVTVPVAQHEKFLRLERPLSDFLEFHLHNDTRATHLYLAQCPLFSLHDDLRNDLPVPTLVTRAGKGDIYDSSIWIGSAPTFTPLHKDPNPNLFVQLAGTKHIRIYEPQIGAEIFAEAQRRIGRHGSASMRGEEMMQGEEKKVLEELVWGDASFGGEGLTIGAEACLEAGDGMFIPKGWWHSIKGVGDGIVGSVNWWFR